MLYTFCLIAPKVFLNVLDWILKLFLLIADSEHPEYLQAVSWQKYVIPCTFEHVDIYGCMRLSFWGIKQNSIWHIAWFRNYIFEISTYVVDNINVWSDALFFVRNSWNIACHISVDFLFAIFYFYLRYVIGLKLHYFIEWRVRAQPTCPAVFFGETSCVSNFAL